ncbi:hypothetical protein GCK72_023071 [Caenorhabditis remanei]|uniref:Eukaryotic translation initiation factor 3 subunit C N-terminal domain-containing protein n=1 Tax=Caenorhabditis remanei TaxID=31234 RepID=A0A6A5FVT3_CAERE|nr:hypothetical protein GCK72_023071 [Caenorhabditis remanei]KAF1746614.1 hypothetical protein GCK72_023071 [Caenorhabditis remanei]
MLFTSIRKKKSLMMSWKKLNEIMSARRKRTTDRNQPVANLQKRLEVSDEKNLGFGIYVEISFCIISDLFVLNANISDFMEYEMFMNTLATVNKLLVLLIGTVCHLSRRR